MTTKPAPPVHLDHLLEQLARGTLVEIPSADRIADAGPETVAHLAALREKWFAERQATLGQSVATLEQLKRTRSDLSSAQGQLREASKLTALGTLAAGIAHEMNQPLTVILGLTDLLSETPNDTIGTHKELLAQIIAAGDTLAQIIDNVLMFARQTKVERQPVAAAHPLHAALALLERTLDLDAIALTTHITTPPELHVLMHTGRMQQVIVNLVVNAHDVLVEHRAKGERRIRLELGRDSQHVEYRISDNGPGVPAGDAERLFEPFFTTKSPGGGLGLGLSVSHGIVTEHDGTLTYERVDPWTTFTVRLPVHGTD